MWQNAASSKDRKKAQTAGSINNSLRLQDYLHHRLGTVARERTRNRRNERWDASTHLNFGGRFQFQVLSSELSFSRWMVVTASATVAIFIFP